MKANWHYAIETAHRGVLDGRRWAQNVADLAQLEWLSLEWPADRQFRVRGALFEFVAAVYRPSAYTTPIMAEQFWRDLGKEPGDFDKCSAPYWNGFVKAAHVVYWERCGQNPRAAMVSAVESIQLT